MGQPQSLRSRYVLMNLTSGHMTNPLLFPKFQVLYPVALTAAIFSMQQEAIPFHLNRRSFALAVFILIAMVYAIRLVIRHGLLYWPSLRRTIALWLRTTQLGRKVDQPSESEFQGRFSPITGIYPDRIMGDEERDVPRTCGTRAVLGPLVTNLQARQGKC